MSYQRPARASGTWRPGHNTAPANAVDGDRHSRWAAPAGALSAWLEVDLDAPTPVGRVVI